jgi:hypothetical protein
VHGSVRENNPRATISCKLYLSWTVYIDMTDNETPRTVTAAKKDYNSRGSCREHWFQMVYRDGQWTYFGDGRLPNGTYLAADRKASVTGEVWPGEFVCRHDRGGPVDRVCVVRADPDAKPLQILEYVRTRGGMLRITLPDGSTVELPDPRKR